MKQSLFIYLVAFISFVTHVACSKSDDLGNSAQIVEQLQKYGWQYKGAPELNEYSSWVEIETNTYTYYFLTEDTGLHLHRCKIENEFGEGRITSKTWDSKFRYTISGNTIELSDGTRFVYVAGGLVDEDRSEFYKPITIDYSDLEDYLPKTGWCGPMVQYSYDRDRMDLTISGEGPMFNYTETRGAPWKDETILDVVVEEGVTHIGDYAFYNTDIENYVTLPASLCSIGDYAFNNCHELNSIVFPNGSQLQTIGAWAFYNSGCADLPIPSSVVELKEGAVAKWGGNVIVGDGGSFSGSKLQIVGDYAFAYSNLQIDNRILHLDEVTHIGDFAFGNEDVVFNTQWKGAVQLDRIVLGNKLKTIGYGAFYPCWISEPVVIPHSVESIEKWSFQGTFNRIDVGKGIKHISGWSFVTPVSGKLYMWSTTPESIDASTLIGVSAPYLDSCTDSEGNKYPSWREVLRGGDDIMNDSNWTLYVPAGCRDNYAELSPWKDFKQIKGFVWDGYIDVNLIAWSDFASIDMKESHPDRNDSNCIGVWLYGVGANIKSLKRIFYWDYTMKDIEQNLSQWGVQSIEELVKRDGYELDGVEMEELTTYNSTWLVVPNLPADSPITGLVWVQFNDGSTAVAWDEMRTGGTATLFSRTGSRVNYGTRQLKPSVQAPACEEIELRSVPHAMR